MASVYSLLLFGGGVLNIDLEMGIFIISLDDGWIRYKAASHQVNLDTDWFLGHASPENWLFLL